MSRAVTLDIVDDYTSYSKLLNQKDDFSHNIPSRMIKLIDSNISF